MLKVEIVITRGMLHYLLERLSMLDIPEIQVVANETMKTKSINGKFDTTNTAKLEFIIEDNYIDNVLQILLTDPKIDNGRIDVIELDRTLMLSKKEGKRIKVVSSVFIRVNREDLFTFITDYRRLAEELPEYIKNIDIINRYDNVTITEEEISIEGISIKHVSKHTTYPYAVHEIEILSGYMEGSKIIETYTEVENGTQVMIVGEFSISKALEEFIGYEPKKVVDDCINKVTNRIKVLAENKFKSGREWK